MLELRAVALALALVCPVANLWAGETRFASGPRQAVMIELYTSQGCSSCPPAERYLNGYKDHPDLWDRYIPLAFHVDYWDYLGWRDRFADPRHDDRQRRYRRLGRVRALYTPAFIANGRSWRPRQGAAVPAASDRVVGELHVTQQGADIHASFRPATVVPERLTFNVALLGMGLSTAIKAGENAGRRSRHEFVVLAHETVTAPGYEWQTRLPSVGDAAPQRLAVAAWVAAPDDPTPLQATGGFLGGGPASAR